MTRSSFSSSAPGRLCLFGEHQDYLGLPVIAMAMDRRVELDWTPRNDGKVIVFSHGLGPVAEFNPGHWKKEDLDTPLGWSLEQMRAENAEWSDRGWDCHIRSRVPVRAGCSSSTALLTAWIAGWQYILHGGFSVEDVVERCHRYEVLDFNGAGGNMDQFACGHGGIHRFGRGAPERLHLPQGTFVLGDSGEPKDTQGHLQRCRDARIPLMAHIDGPTGPLSEGDRLLLEGTRVNRDLEEHWARAMRAGPPDGAAFGADLTRHHAVLRDVLGLSTPRIESMLTGALSAGAWGGKINGSGGGGCAFALCPDEAVEAVCEAMCAAGAAGAWPVVMESGVRCPD